MFATMEDAHREWHWNAGVPMGTPGCPQDACHPFDDWEDGADGADGAETIEKPEAVILDMDGTLADVSSIRHLVTGVRPKNFDAFHAESVNVPPNSEAVEIARSAAARGQTVIIVTARRHRWRHHTAWFLAMNDIPSDVMIMRGDQDMRSDVDVKRDILAQIRTRWTPVLAVDDNPAIVDLWESEGLPVVVIPGWPYSTHA